MIEKDYDVSFVAAIALREKQIQQNYRPVIAVHKWFARRPGTLFRSLLLSEFGHGALRDIYFKVHDLKGLQVADPFMGGGTPLLEANRLGAMLSATISTLWHTGLSTKRSLPLIFTPTAKPLTSLWPGLKIR